MKFIKELDLMPICIILLCFTTIFFMFAYKNTNNSLRELISNIQSQVPKIAQDSYRTGCLDAMNDFSLKSQEEINEICIQGSEQYSQPIEHLFNGSN